MFFQTFFSTGSTDLDPTLLCARAPLTLEELCARYRSPVSGSITTISLPLFSGRAATFKAADDLAAFMEAYLALQNGISNAQLQAAVQEKKLSYRDKTIAGINLGEVYRGFY